MTLAGDNGACQCLELTRHRNFVSSRSGDSLADDFWKKYFLFLRF